LIGGAGRIDLPTGDPDALYDSLFHRVLTLDPALLIHPAHDYKGQGHSTLGDEIATNPRLQNRDRKSFVAMMKGLDLELPAHLTEALRVNIHGGKPLVNFDESLFGAVDRWKLDGGRLGTEQRAGFTKVAVGVHVDRSDPLSGNPDRQGLAGLHAA